MTFSSVRPPLSRSTSTSGPAPPAAPPFRHDDAVSVALDIVLELNDGSAFRGFSFGAQGKSVAGECVFQTGKFFE